MDVKQILFSNPFALHRKEVIQPLVLERLPCYDFTPVAYPTFGCVLLAVKLQTSGVTNSHGVTGGVYKARERIHRGMLIRDYEQFQLHAGGLQPAIRTETVFKVSLHLAVSPPVVNGHCITCVAQVIRGMMI